MLFMNGTTSEVKAVDRRDKMLSMAERAKIVYACAKLAKSKMRFIKVFGSKGG